MRNYRLVSVFVFFMGLGLLSQCGDKGSSHKMSHKGHTMTHEAHGMGDPVPGLSKKVHVQELYAVASQKKGKKIYQTHCASCHGAHGEGEDQQHRMGGKKAKGGFYAPALNGTAHSWHHHPDQAFNKILKGSPDKTSSMRGFEGKLSEEEIKLVMSYYMSLWPETTRETYKEKFGGKK